MRQIEMQAVYTGRSGTVPLLGRDTAPDEHEHEQMSVPTADLFRRDAGPPIEGDQVSPTTARSTDASRLTFPIQMLIGAVIMTASIIGSVYGLTSGMRESLQAQASDLRDMRTRMELQARIDEAEQRAATVEMKAQNDSINELKRLTQMLQIQYSELSKQIQRR